MKIIFTSELKNSNREKALNVACLLDKWRACSWRQDRLCHRNKTQADILCNPVARPDLGTIQQDMVSPLETLEGSSNLPDSDIHWDYWQFGHRGSRILPRWGEEENEKLCMRLEKYTSIELSGKWVLNETNGCRLQESSRIFQESSRIFQEAEWKV